MLFTAHALGGGVSGELVGNPFWAFLLGFVLHFILDFIPHYDTTDDGKYTPRQIALVCTDFIIGALILTILLFYYSHNRWSLISGAFGGILPDILSLVPPIRKFTMKNRYWRIFHEIHNKIQSVKISPVPGLLIQILVWIISVSILIVYR